MSLSDKYYRRMRFATAVDGVYMAVDKAVPRPEIASTISGYSEGARELVANAFRRYGPDGIPPDAVCRDLPEGFLWAWAGRGERPLGDWTHTGNAWKWGVASLRGALHDPVLAEPLRSMQGPDPDLTARIWAVIAVIAEADAMEARRTPVRRSCSPFVLEEHHRDRTEGRALPKYWDMDQPARRLRNPDLTALVFARPQEAQRIAALMHERSTDDAEFIASILDADTPALSEGML